MAERFGKERYNQSLRQRQDRVHRADARTGGKFTLSGDGLCIGYDSGDAVSDGYKSPGKFTGGTIKVVGVTVEKAQYLDREKLAAAMSVD